MQSTVIRKGIVKKGRRYCILFFAFLVQAGPLLAQSISLSLKEAPIVRAFRKIEAQSDLYFIYSSEAIHGAKPVSVELRGAGVEEALVQVFAGQPLSYRVEEGQVFVKAGAAVPQTAVVDVSGTVADEEGAPLQGVSVVVNGGSKGTVTDAAGQYFLAAVDEHAVLLFSFVGRESLQVPVKGRRNINVILKAVSKALDETIVQAYGTTTRRLNTGNISKVTAEEIARQPVSNVLAALEGRVPGMVVTQSTGLPGSSFKVQIRGRTAIEPTITADEPLFIIDGVPFAPNNNYLSSLNSALGFPSASSRTGGVSPFTLVDPKNIESIEVLKDADATAIYGSRGANGVILITTKAGSGGKGSLNASLETGVSAVATKLHMMNTEQYLRMRREAFANDAIPPSQANAYDLMVWDTARFTNFQKLLLGGTAHHTAFRVGASGGNANTNFLIGTDYNKQSTVFPQHFADTRVGAQVSLKHTSPKRRLDASFTASYVSDNNNSLATDLAFFSDLPPNFRLYDGNAKLAWNEGGIASGSNPLALLNATYQTTADNLISSSRVNYKIANFLSASVNFGFNEVLFREGKLNPASAQNPNQSSGRSSAFASKNYKSWIAEPQLRFFNRRERNSLEVLLGSTWQNQKTDVSEISASGYIDDNLMYSTSGATDISATKSLTHYRYNAFFGRANLNIDEKYVINVTGRRDGSSRFGATKRFALFKSIGSAWIFSREAFISRNLKFLDFGKIRASLGTTGNDKITDYLYLDTWQSSQNSYQDVGAIQPVRLFNPEYRWEKTTKLEVALDVSCFDERVDASISFYRNRSSNQLVNYKLPTTTGFTGVIRNFPALVQNTGTEVTFGTVNVESGSFRWSTRLNVTFPDTKLLEFPNLQNSSYASSFVVGQSLNLIYKYKFTGVDPQTGLYTVEDANKDGLLDKSDLQVFGSVDPRLFGGIGNHINYKGFQFDLFVQFVKQTGMNYVGFTGGPAGTIRNMPIELLDRWTGRGDLAAFQRYTQANSGNNAAYTSYNYFLESNGIYSDASFVRVKNLSFTYTLPFKLVSKLGITKCETSLSAQNILTLTDFVADPETQDYRRLPPLKTLNLGILFAL